MRLAVTYASGLAAGAVGAATWAALSYCCSWEMSYLAWAIGLLVGVAVHLGHGGRSGALPGAIAVGITLLAVAAGKLASVVVRPDPAPSPIVLAEPEDLLSVTEPEVAISFLADEVAMERIARGEEIVWPEGVDPCFVRVESDYPVDLWAEAKGRWEAMSPPRRQAFFDRIRAESSTPLPTARELGLWHCLRPRLGFFDLLFLGLALVTAFRFGAGKPA